MIIDRAKLLIRLLDYTSLGENDSESTVLSMCQLAEWLGHSGPRTNLAALCVKPEFVKLAKANTKVAIATVANFPKGDLTTDQVLKDVHNSLLDGADEIDLVVPYGEILSGSVSRTKNLLQGVRKVAQGKIFKVILESGLMNQEQIFNTSLLSLDCGADFIKTSTGKVTIGATEQAVTTILKALKGYEAGIKVSGGVKTTEVANDYLELIETSLELKPEKVRLGASSLLDEILKQQNWDKVKTTSYSY